MDFVFATGNMGKLREASEILGPSYSLCTPADLGFHEDVEETGSTMRENAIIKAEHLWKLTGRDCFADDSGLEVDALDGAPGVYTARYAGEGKDFIQNMTKLLGELEPYKEPAQRTARFRCVVAMIKDGKTSIFEGTLEGRIAFSMCGNGGFGYDPVFIPEGYDKTLAEIPEAEKNAISHRFVALDKMRKALSAE